MSRSALSRTATPCRLNLHGLKGPELFSATYMSRDRLAAWRAGASDPIRWIVIDDHGLPAGPARVRFPSRGVPFRTPDAETQIVAVRQGIGITKLPCFVGDADPMLVRAPGNNPRMNATLWLLTQGETRKTKRVRLFLEFISRRLAAHATASRGTVLSAQLMRGRLPAKWATRKGSLDVTFVGQNSSGVKIFSPISAMPS